MASDNETVAEVAKRMRRNEEVFHHLYWCEYAVRIEAAHRRAVESYKRLLATSQCALEDEIVKNQNLKREVAELRECLKEAIGVACDGCHLAVWHNRELVKCKKHSNWKCPFGTERWCKALEGANHEGK